MKQLITLFGLVILISCITSLKSREKNDKKIEYCYHELADRIDTVIVNDSLEVIYTFKKGLLSKMSTRHKSQGEIQRIVFYNDSQLKKFFLSRAAYKGIKWNDDGTGEYYYYSQKLELDSIGNTTYHLLTKDFEIISETKN